MEISNGAIPLSGNIEGAFIRVDAPSPKGLVLISHGLGEHSARYKHVMQFLFDRGYSVYVMDHRGHGLSGGPRGHVMSFDQYAADLLSHLQNARQGNGELPWFLLGHSMGGLVALYYCLTHAQNLPQALMVTSPLLGVTAEVPKIKEIAGNMMSRIWPSLSLSNEIDATYVCRDKGVVEAYLDDPLVHDKVSARWFTSMNDAMARLHAEAGSMRLPVQIQAAGDDRLVSTPDAMKFYERLGSTDKESVVYENWYHEILNDQEQDKPLGKIADWIEAHLTA